MQEICGLRHASTVLLGAGMMMTTVALLAAQHEPTERGVAFEPPEAVSVTDISTPIAGGGTVVLDVVVAERGKPQKIEVRRDIATLTPLATQAVQNWEFSPATLAGKVIDARIPVAVTFRPPGFATAVPLPPLIPQSEAAIQAAFQPAEVTHTAFPGYPATTVASGAVILGVTLSEKGALDRVKVLRNLPPLTEEAKIAAGEFRFLAAALNGTPVPSTVVLAFVSQPFTNTASFVFSANQSLAPHRGR